MKGPWRFHTSEGGFQLRRRSDGRIAEYGPAGDRLTEWMEPITNEHGAIWCDACMGWVPA